MQGLRLVSFLLLFLCFVFCCCYIHTYLSTYTSGEVMEAVGGYNQFIQQICIFAVQLPYFINFPFHPPYPLFANVVST